MTKKPALVSQTTAAKEFSSELITWSSLYENVTCSRFFYRRKKRIKWLKLPKVDQLQYVESVFLFLVPIFELFHLCLRIEDTFDFWKTEQWWSSCCWFTSEQQNKGIDLRTSMCFYNCVNNFVVDSIPQFNRTIFWTRNKNVSLRSISNLWLFSRWI